MAGINFLPSDSSKGSLKEEKKIRTIEFTSPSASQDKKKDERRGGVLSIFKRREKPYPTPPPLPSIAHQKEGEPQIASHMQGPKKTVTKFIQVEQKLEGQEKAPQKKKTRNWFSRLFSRKERLDILSSQEQTVEEEKESLNYSSVAKAPPPPTVKTSAVSGGRGQRESFITEQEPKDITPSAIPPRFDPYSFSKATQNKAQPPKTREPLFTAKPQSSQTPQAPTAPSKIAPRYTDVRREAGPLAQGLSFDVNLVPDELAQRKRSMSRLNLLWLVIAMSLFVVGAGYGILEFYKQNVSSEAAGVENDLARVNDQIVKLEPIQRDALVLKKRTEEISRLLQKQPLWTEFFASLEKNTLANVQIVDLKADANGTVTMVAQAANPDFGFEQLQVYKNATDFVSEARFTQQPTIPTTGSGTQDQNFILPNDIIPGGIPVATPTTPQPGTSTTNYSSFTIVLTLNPELLYHKPTP